jgi:hypothetical protein
MLKNFQSSSHRRSQLRRGWTLLETLVTMIGGTAVLGSILVTGTSVSNSMVAIVNYNDLNKSSRNTLDVLSRDFRNTSVVSSLSANQVSVTNALTGDSLVYSWDGSNTLTRTFDGVSTVMLTGCDTLIFNGYQRNPTNNFQFVPANTASEIKLISVSWRCARTILGAKLNTESVQTAQICIRN